MNLPEAAIFWILIPLGIVVFIVIAVVSYLYEEQRRKELAAEAASLGLRFQPEKNHEYGRHFSFLNRLNEGSNRYTQNMVMGKWKGEGVSAFDFHYETTSRDSKGKERTESHWHHVYLLLLPVSFPELTIGPENIFTRMAKNFGFQSIDFESAEFSRRFLVRSRDKKFAYDICHPRAMAYLLANPDLVIEIEDKYYAFVFQGPMRPGKMQREFDRLLALRALMPEYLFSEVRNG